MLHLQVVQNISTEAMKENVVQFHTCINLYSLIFTGNK